MILTFSETKFEKGIIAGTKRTSLREDKKSRWRIGRLIHFWLHNPRNVKLNPHCFAVGKVVNIEIIKIDFDDDTIYIFDPEENNVSMIVSFDGLEDFAKIDGFDSWNDMKAWFLNRKKNIFRGKRIWFEVHTIFL